MLQDLKDFAPVVGGIVALSTFVFATWQYRQAQRWKKAEFVANEMKQFRSDPKNSIALTMLDWNSRKIRFSAGKEDKSYIVDDLLISEALRLYSIEDYKDGKENIFHPPQNHIRDVFDHLLDDIERLNSFVTAGLIKADDLRPYLEYWLDIMSGKSRRKPDDVIKKLWIYIDAYNYKGVRKIFSKLGYDNDIPATSKHIDPRITSPNALQFSGK